MKRARMTLALAITAQVLLLPATATEEAPEETRYQYKLLATSKTSTMEKEINEATEAGFRFEGAMGGETGFGGKEVVSILSKPVDARSKGAYHYKLLATNKTSTMQKEMAEAAAAGYRYRSQTVSETLFGGKEIVVIMERTAGADARYDYKLLATTKTSTMQKELSEVADAGFVFRGVTVGNTAFGGREVVVITERLRAQ